MGLTLTAFLIALSGLLPWQGRDIIEGLVRPTDDTGLITLYSANRHGEGGSVSAGTSQVLEHSPILGFGFSGADFAYDNAWLQFLVFAGYVGVVLYTFVLAKTLALARRLSRGHQPERILALSLSILATFGGLGGPTLTLNRIGSIMCLLLGFLVASESRTRGISGDKEEGVQGLHTR